MNVEFDSLAFDLPNWVPPEDGDHDVGADAVSVAQAKTREAFRRLSSSTPPCMFSGDLAKYEGTFSSPGWGDLTISADGEGDDPCGKLMATLPSTARPTGIWRPSSGIWLSFERRGLHRWSVGPGALIATP